jgi:Uma2 family endonuclease
MAASTQISLEQYLRSVYRPDREYVDGVIEERNLGELDHSWIQARLVAFFLSRFPETGIAALPEWRFQVQPTRFRVPDIVVTKGKPSEPILTQPPLLCVEVLSPDDTVSKMNLRIQEYLDFGVPVVWLVDPSEKTVWIYRKDGMQSISEGAIRLDGTLLEIPLSEIFD